jgi:GT2 family glycosyltransferase
MIFFSVIIPTCHRNNDLERCLESLKLSCSSESGRSKGSESASGDPGFRCEVIVTDDGSKSTAKALLKERFPWGRWVEGPRRGPAANRNSGASQAKGDWLIFIDDDCIPEPDLLAAYATAIQDHPASSVFEGRTIPIGQKTSADQECPVNLEGGLLWSCNFSVKRSLFLELGAFDENFPLAGLEDMDFQRRLENGSHAIKFVSEAVVKHPWRSRRGAKFSLALAKSITYFTKKYPSAKSAFAQAWGIKRIVKIVTVEFLRNFLRYRNAGAFRVLYLDLVLAIHLSLLFVRETANPKDEHA